MNKLVAALLGGDSSTSVVETERLRADGVGTEEIILQGVEVAMAELDAKCTVEQFNLLEIMLSGRAVTEVMKVLCPVGSPAPTTKGTVVLATLEGDVHDLGKNILKMVLTGSGYRVVDCGKDCPVENLIATAERERPLAVGISGLITQVILQVRQVRPRLADVGLFSLPIFAGGAALKQSSAESLCVDFVAESAFDGLHFVEQLAASSDE
jgi:methanogenic corrinoid protein MtbC1